VTVVGRLLTALGHVLYRRQKQADNFCLLVAFDDGGRAVAKFSKSGVWDNFPEGSTLLFGETNFFKNTILACDKQTHTCRQTQAHSKYPR